MTITIESDRDLRIARLFDVLWHGERTCLSTAAGYDAQLRATLPEALRPEQP